MDKQVRERAEKEVLRAMNELTGWNSAGRGKNPLLKGTEEDKK